MLLNDAMKQELIQELHSVFSLEGKVTLKNFNQLHGADAITFSFTLTDDEGNIPLILRMYRGITNRAETEFKVLRILYNGNLSVPQPFTWKKESPAFKRSYMVMEQVPGTMLSQYLMLADHNERTQLFEQLITELVKVHTFDWKKLALEQPKSSVNFVEQVLAYPKKLVDNHNIGELQQLIEWLEVHQVESNTKSLLHGDYHVDNIIITPEKNLVILDWSAPRLGDFRHDLGFLIVTTASMGSIDVKTIFTNMYQKQANIEVYDIEYFMILSNLYNLLRVYSAIAILDPNLNLTHETETTKKVLLQNYKVYVQALVSLVQQITEIHLSTVEQALD